MHFITWVLLIQVINISIDPLDPVSNKLGRLFYQEDLNVSDIESIYELASEQLLGVDVPEYDEDFCFTNTSIKINTKYEELQISFFGREKNFNSVLLDHTSPPPKVV